MPRSLTLACSKALFLVLLASLARTVGAQETRTGVPETLPVKPGKEENVLVECSAHGEVKAVVDLLERGADPNSVDDAGRTPLHRAADREHIEVMRVLIDHGANVNARDASGCSVLFEAASSPSPQAIEMLLAAGAKPEDVALVRACYLGRTESAKLLLDAGVSPDAGIADAANSRHPELVQMLLQRGADVNAASSRGYAALHLATEHKIVQLLLEAGADPNARENETCETPLFSLSDHRDLEIVKLLVRAGARLDLPNKGGITAVRHAAICGTREIYDWLLEINGGTEPRFARSDTPFPLFQDKSSQELIAEYASATGKEQRLAVQPELVLRGKEMIPLAIEHIESGTPIEMFYPLFEAMGPEAEDALPLITQQLSKKDHVFMAAITLERMKPGARDVLPEEAKQGMATALYNAIVEGDEPIMCAMCLSLLVSMGDSAASTIMRLLQHDAAEYRLCMARAMDRDVYRFGDKRIEAELVKMMQGDVEPAVRAGAASAIGACAAPSQATLDALLAVLRNPPERGPTRHDRNAGRQEWRTMADSAGKSLARFGPRVIDDLVPLLSPMGSPTRLPVIATLQAIGAPAVPRLVELLGHEDPAIAISASVTLNRIGRPAVPSLAEAVTTGNEQVVEHAASALWWASGPARAALPNLLEVAASENRSDRSRLAAARTVMKIDPDVGRESQAILSTIPVLIRILDKGGFLHQGQAAETLGAIGASAKDALPMLHERAVPPDKDVDTEGLVTDYVQRAAEAAIGAIEIDLEAAKTDSPTSSPASARVP